MYEISFHLKLYTIIYWTKIYSPKLRFHNKVVYKCKSLSKWWLWACKSTFYLIKKGRICGPCETKHDKPNRLAIHCFCMGSDCNVWCWYFFGKLYVVRLIWSVWEWFEDWFCQIELVQSKKKLWYQEFFVENGLNT